MAAEAAAVVTAEAEVVEPVRTATRKGARILVLVVPTLATAMHMVETERGVEMAHQGVLATEMKPGKAVVLVAPERAHALQVLQAGRMVAAAMHTVQRGMRRLDTRRL